jgi:hypothetical protein
VYALGTPAQQERFRYNPRHFVELSAPHSEGRYKIIYNQIPFFSESGTDDLPPASTSVPTNTLRQQLARHLLGNSSAWQEVGTFSVRSRVAHSLLPPQLYLTVNGEVPGTKTIATGTVERPLTFEWSVNSEFRRSPGSNLSYRYQLDGEEWTDWSRATETVVFFLPKGSHEFRVKAKYEGDEGIVESEMARYSFFLSAPFVARPTKQALLKPATIGNIVTLPTPDIETTYSGSRALLFGIYKFDDQSAFPQLPGDRIERDIATLQGALIRNGFEVDVLVRPSITTSDVRLAIDEFIKGSRDNDRIYFSSHGFADPNQPTDGYIATTDCKARSASATCLALGSFRQQLNESISRNARQIVIAVDSCFSGLGVIVKSPPETNLTELARRKGIHMLTAGMEHQNAQIDEVLKMSTFTYYLAKGLDGDADLFKNGVISLTELFLYVQYEVASRTSSSQIPMMGRVFGSGEMLFRSPTSRQAAQ